MTGGGGSDQAFGDAYELFDRTAGRDDLLLGGSGDDALFGDGYALRGWAEGGDDLLIGNGGNNSLFGDSFALAAGVRAGDDVLDGGKGSDVLFGDAAERQPQARGGSDVFRFAPGGGDDVIGDFDDAAGGPQDLIDLSGWRQIGGFADFAGHLSGNLLNLDGFGSRPGADTLLVSFAGGVGSLDAGDFLFA